MLIQTEPEGEDTRNELSPLTWTNSLVVKWHVLLVHNQPTNSFLSVPTGEFISQLRPSRLPYQHLYQSLVVICIRDHDFVNISRDGRLVHHRRVFVRHCGGLSCEGVIVGVRGCLFVDVHIAGVDSFPHAREAIGLDDIVLFVNLTIFYGSICKAIEPVCGGDVSANVGSRACENGDEKRKRE